MSETKRKILIIVVLLLVVLFGVGQFFAGSSLNAPTQPAQNQTSTPPAQIPTQIFAYTPPTPASSTPIEKGSCFANSVAEPYRADAWRCTVGNSISDPCFAIPGSSNLFCGANPATESTSSSFVLQLTKALPKPDIASGTDSSWAWLVELADGTICSPYTGTRPFSATGDVAYYSCDSSDPGEGMIFGDLNDSSSVWTAEVGLLSQSTSTFPPALVVSSTAPVMTVWQ